MNKVILMGRLTRDVEMHYSKTENPVAVAKYALAVRRQYSKQGETDVDFFNVVAFGKAAEFAEKYFNKGQMVAVSGRLQINNYEDKDKVKRTSIDVIVEEQHFTGGKNDNGSSGNTGVNTNAVEEDEEPLPF